MTPDERAAQVLERERRPLEDMIAAAICEAMQAAYEDALQQVSDQANDLPAEVDSGFYYGYKTAIAKSIKAIRARAKEVTT